MAGKKTPLINPGALVVLSALYHAAALAVDAESVAANLKRFNANPTWANLARALLAEGVFIKDLGLPE